MWRIFSNVNRFLLALIFLFAACAPLSTGVQAAENDKPNIVLVFMDNFGWGEPGFNGGGIIRGAPTPRWTAYEAVRYGIKTPKEAPMKTQERAYTSPIWYNPK